MPRHCLVHRTVQPTFAGAATGRHGLESQVFHDDPCGVHLHDVGRNAVYFAAAAHSQYAAFAGEGQLLFAARLAAALGTTYGLLEAFALRQPQGRVLRAVRERTVGLYAHVDTYGLARVRRDHHDVMLHVEAGA